MNDFTIASGVIEIEFDLDHKVWVCVYVQLPSGCCQHHSGKTGALPGMALLQSGELKLQLPLGLADTSRKEWESRVPTSPTSHHLFLPFTDAG